MDEIRTVDQVISRGAERFGRSIAYEHNGVTLDFVQLAHDATLLSDRLTSEGVLPGDPVAVVLEKSLNFIRALAGILFAGAIYVPVDTRNPDDRMQYVLRDSGVKHIITASTNISRLSTLIDSTVRLVVLDPQITFPVERAILNPTRAQPNRETDLAYIIYTSGSTRMPKGVAIKHESLVNYIKETVKTYGFDTETRLLSVKSFSYDASLTDIFCPLYAGGTAHLLDEGLILPPIIEQKLVRHGITHMSCTPVVLRLLAERGSLSPKVFASMKTMSVGGDVVPSGAFRKIQDRLPNLRLFNRYGPTETTVTCCTYELKRIVNANDVVPIGKPHNSVILRAINADGEGIRVNEAGELYIGGVQVMAGYWGAPGLTANVITDRFGDGLRYYRTSDLVTINEEGDYIFLRRLGSIVKKNGYRVSLNEIEAAIVRGGLASECVCVFLPEQADGTQAKIVAFLNSPETTIREQEIRERLLRLLPVHMIPDSFAHVASIPRELSGKPARQMLKNQVL